MIFRTSAIEVVPGSVTPPQSRDLEWVKPVQWQQSCGNFLFVIFFSGTQLACPAKESNLFECMSTHTAVAHFISFMNLCAHPQRGGAEVLHGRATEGARSGGGGCRVCGFPCARNGATVFVFSFERPFLQGRPKKSISFLNTHLYAITRDDLKPSKMAQMF